MGRKSKGERVLLGTRVPPDLAELVKQRVHEQGFETVNDYLLCLTASDNDYVVADPRNSHEHQEQLPMTG